MGFVGQSSAWKTQGGILVKNNLSPAPQAHPNLETQGWWDAWRIPYLSDYKMYFPPQIWEENGGVSYSWNVAYLARWGGGEGGRGGVGFFFPIFLL